MPEKRDAGNISKQTNGLKWLTPTWTWEALKGIALAIAATFSFFANQNAEQAKQELEKAKIAAAEKGQQSQLDIKAFELVEKALSVKPESAAGYGIAAGAIVNALTRPPLRDGLQNALRAGSIDPVLNRKLDDAKQFDLESYPSDAPAGSASRQKQSSILNDAFTMAGWTLISYARAQSSNDRLARYRVDMFFCEDASQTLTKERKTRADTAYEKLRKSVPSVTARVRLLPTLVQARPGYQSFSDEIRFNDEGEEKAAALQLANIIGLVNESLHRIDYKTPGYLSVFYCAGK